LSTEQAPNPNKFQLQRACADNVVPRNYDAVRRAWLSADPTSGVQKLNTPESRPRGLPEAGRN